MIQVDTACHKVPRFIEKAGAAGVKRVFLGLENIDPENLSAAKKKQNHIADYREVLLAWRKQRCITYCGYILGFPNDTPQSIVRHIEVIKRELPLDILEFSILTPLPGSEDHARAVAAGVPIDPDLNKFDLEHVTTDHPRMSREELQEAYRLAWRTYYTEDHIRTVIRRAVAGGPRPDTVAYLVTWFWATFRFYNTFPVEAGMVRRKHRRDRRPGLPLENPLTFYPRYFGDLIVSSARIAALFAKVHLMVRRIERDPNSKTYTDEALRLTRRLRASGNVPALRGGAAGRRQGEARRGAPPLRRGGEGGRGGVSDDLPEVLRNVRTRPLLVMRLSARKLEIIGPTPAGIRRVGVIFGGSFAGERLSGEVLDGGADWQIVRSDGATTLDVRLMLKTHDGALIGMSYRGTRHGPPDIIARIEAGETVDPATHYFRSAPFFETAAPNYDWINRIVAIGIGHRQADGPVYSVFEVL